MAFNSANLLLYIGEVRPNFPEGKLPSNQEILQVFLYYHNTLKKTISEASWITTDLILPFWKAAHIPLIRANKISDKIKSLFKDWKKVKKNHKRDSAAQRKNEREFLVKMKKLFDIALSKALEIMDNEEEKRFLIGQREPSRKGWLSSEKIATARAQLAHERQHCDRYGRQRKAVQSDGK